jgi:uncharacterized caspase-like protein
MYIALVGTFQQGAGPAALSIILVDGGGNQLDELENMDLAGPNFAHPIDSGAGQIDVTGSAAGGDGSYSYAWTVSETGDDDNTGTGVIRILSAGTTNAAQYNTLTLRSTASAGSPPTDANYTLTCTVTDGTGATASVQIVQRVMGLNLG